METIEELKEKHAKEMLELQTAHEIALSLPRPPVRVLFASVAQPWIIYNVDTLQQAVLLAEGFNNWADYVIARDAFCSLQPESRLKPEDKYKSYERVIGGAPYLHLNNIDNQYDDAELCFFTDTVVGKTAKVLIKIKQVPARIPIFVLHETRDRRRAEIRKDYPYLQEDQKVQWASGGDKSASASYVWYTIDGYRDAMDALIERSARKGVAA